MVQLGEGENQLPGICAEIEKAKKEGGVSKKELLLRIAKIPGIYIPAFYDVEYYEDGRVKAITPMSRASRRASPRRSSRT